MVYSLLGLPGLNNPLNPGIGIPGQGMLPVGPMGGAMGGMGQPMGQPPGGMPMPHPMPQMPQPMPGMPMGAGHPPGPVPPMPQQPGILQQMGAMAGGLGQMGQMGNLLGGLGKGQQGLTPQMMQAAGMPMGNVSISGGTPGGQQAAAPMNWWDMLGHGAGGV